MEKNAAEVESETELPTQVQEPVVKATRPQGRLVHLYYRAMCCFIEIFNYQVFLTDVFYEIHFTY